MQNTLESIYSQKQVESITKDLYFYSKHHNKEETESFFKRIFKVPYELIAGNEDIYVFINDYFCKYYKNEKIIKSLFAKKMLKKTKTTLFFEFALDGNRLDIASIGDKSVAYEIKTKYDTLNRLPRQLNAYSKYFEYVYVICDCSKTGSVLELSNPNVGVIEYDDSNASVCFRTIRKAKRQYGIDSNKQLKILSKCEIKEEFGKTEKDKIVSFFSNAHINSIFKKIIKTRYDDAWKSISSKSNQICDFDFENQYKKLKHQFM